MRSYKTLILAVILLAIMSVCACNFTLLDKQLIINEVVTENVNSYKTGDTSFSSWVELYNPGSSEVSLADYVIYMNDLNRYTFSADDKVPAKGYYVLPATDGIESADAKIASFAFDRDGCTLKLCTSDGKKVDELTVPKLRPDISWCLIDKRFVYCSTATPNAQNDGIFADTLDALISEDLLLNEATRDYVELYNASDADIDLSVFCLSDNIDNTDKWSLPAEMLSPGEYYLVSLDNSGNPASSYVPENSNDFDAYASFKLGSDETSIYLCKNEIVVSTLTVPQNLVSVSAGLNENKEFAYFLFPTPGSANSGATANSVAFSDMSDSDAVRITEVQFNNKSTLVDKYGIRTAWVEIHNYSDVEVDLSCYALSDDTDMDKWRFPSVTIAPNEYMVVFLSGSGNCDGELNTSFKVSETETLCLTDLTTMHTQSIYVAKENRLPDTSFGVFDGEWLYFGRPTPWAENTTKGFADIQNAEGIDSNGIWISEVCSTSRARSGELDWIELYNGGDTEVDLSTLYISKDIDEPYMHQLSGTISAHSYKVIYATDNVTKQKDGILPFGISVSGEELLIVNASGVTLDHISTGALRVNVTSGRLSDDYSGQKYFFTTPTKGEQNSSGTLYVAQKPRFSLQGGFYPDNESLTVTITAKGEIRYTLDGSTPTRESTLYTEPITISKSTALSAISFEDDSLNSETAVATYLFEEKHTLPVVCLSISSSDFSAVCSVKSKKDPIIERKCNIEYFEADGTLGTSFPAGVRIGGNSTRTYNQKTLNVHMRGSYGRSSVIYPFFEDYKITEFSSLVLRNAGQNCHSARIADAFCSMLPKGMNVDYAETRFVIMYVNGSYYGIYDLKENQNEEFFTTRNGGNPDLVNSIKRNYGVLKGSTEQIREVYRMAQTMDLADQDNFDKFAEYVDTDAFIDYLIIQTYIGNIDLFNQKFMNTSDYTVRWRPIYFDLDYGMYSYWSNTMAIFYSGDGIPSPDGSLTNMYIPTALIRNKDFKNKLIERYAECLNTVFSHSVELFDKMVSELEPEMERHIERWGTPSSMSKWNAAIADIRERVVARTELIKGQLQDYYGLSDARMNELFPND